MLLNIMRIVALTIRRRRVEKINESLVASTYYNDSTVTDGGSYRYFDHSGRRQT